ncbi:MAG: hypothetical protein WDN23_14020 [Edaphobacter sp.]
MDQVELERVVIPRLGRSRDRVRDWLQLIVQGRRFDDLSLGLQLVEDLLAHLNLDVLVLRLWILRLWLRLWLRLRILRRLILCLRTAPCRASRPFDRHGAAEGCEAKCCRDELSFH